MQPGGPRILFAGPLTARNLRRIRTIGHGWIPLMDESPDKVRDGVALLRQEWEGAGRDPARLRVRVPLPLCRDRAGRPLLEETMQQAGRFAGWGVTEVSVPVAAFVPDQVGIAAFLRRLGAAWQAAG